MIKVIHEHSVDLDILGPYGNILDLGCRGFQFTNYFRENGFKVYPVDIDPDLEGMYFNYAITDRNGMVGIERSSDPQGTRVKEGNEITCYTLESFSKFVDVPFWDLIKMDVEGAEYDIIMSLDKGIAKQLSIEFHLHTGIYSQGDMAVMYARLLELGYKKAIHELTNQHGAGLNYWDSLFIL